jgi:hypothetical protein
MPPTESEIKQISYWFDARLTIQLPKKSIMRGGEITGRKKKATIGSTVLALLAPAFLVRHARRPLQFCIPAGRSPELRQSHEGQRRWLVACLHWAKTCQVGPLALSESVYFIAHGPVVVSLTAEAGRRKQADGTGHSPSSSSASSSSPSKLVFTRKS